MPAIAFLGSPVIAVGIGLIVAIYGLAGRYTKDETIEHMERGIKSAGIIILVTTNTFTFCNCIFGKTYSRKWYSCHDYSGINNCTNNCKP